MEEIRNVEDIFLDGIEEVVPERKEYMHVRGEIIDARNLALQFRGMKHYRKEQQRISAISKNIGMILNDLITDLKQHSNPHFQGLATQIMAKVRDFVGQDGQLRQMANMTIYQLDQSIPLLHISAINNLVIPMLRGKGVALREGEEFRTVKISDDGERAKFTIYKVRVGKEITNGQLPLIICNFTPKTIGNGVQFGTVLTLSGGGVGERVGLTELNKKYYIKSYRGFPTVNTPGTGALARTTALIEPLDLKEMVAYKILEKLDMGPKTRFFINPDVRNGLFIATDDMGHGEGVEYKDASHIYSFDKKGIRRRSFVQLLERSENHYNLDPIKVGLTKADIMGRCLRITDFNEGNIGCINPIKREGLGEGERKGDGDRTYGDWRIIDFTTRYLEKKRGHLLSDGTEDDDRACLNGFLSGNSVFRYLGGSVLNHILVNRKDSEKLKCAEVIFREHFTVDEIRVAIEESLKEVVDFVTKTGAIEFCEEGAAKNLAKYCGEVTENFRMIERVTKVRLRDMQAQQRTPN